MSWDEYRMINGLTYECNATRIRELTHYRKGRRDHDPNYVPPARAEVTEADLRSV